MNTTIALIGCGNVGGSIISEVMLTPLPIGIMGVCVSRPKAARNFPKVHIVNDVDDILSNPDVEIVIDCTQSPDLEELVKEKSKNSNKIFFYVNKNFYKEHGIDVNHWDEKKQAAIILATKIIDAITDYNSSGKWVAPS
jgi:predicted dinucleotide-utilizing enzyme